MSSQLKETVQLMTRDQCGILAADESVPTITKRLQAVGLESTEESRLAYRTMLLTTPKLNQHVAAVILHEETLHQQISGLSVASFCQKQQIVPGIKVDKGLLALYGQTNQKITQGIDGLETRLETYAQAGARFCKWRAVFNVIEQNPLATKINAQRLAMYAKICQHLNLVPIVEPEVLIDGSHSLEQCFAATESVLNMTFSALYEHHVTLEHIILKPSMVISGKQSSMPAAAADVAKATLTVLRRYVPAAVPSINFLSGGQTPEQATEHLAIINQLAPLGPWRLSFSYARALQEPCLAQWAQDTSDPQTAQQLLLARAKANSQTMASLVTSA